MGGWMDEEEKNFKQQPNGEMGAQEKADMNNARLRQMNTATTAVVDVVVGGLKK